jgi:hypothetical protein
MMHWRIKQMARAVKHQATLLLGGFGRDRWPALRRRL